MPPASSTSTDSGALIDVNAWLGAWPFSLVPARTPARLVAHLAASGVTRALVSPFGAVFQPDPMPANRALFQAVRRIHALVPLPVINLRLASWRDQIEECAAAGASAVKLLPNYHNYRLGDSVVREFMTALAEIKLRLVVNVRLEDERSRYFALNIKGVPTADLAQFLRRFPGHHVLLTGLYLPEFKKLAKLHPNFSADIAFCEWQDTLGDMLRAAPARRIMLGTCTPLLSTRGEADKLRLARIPAKTRELISSGNARSFFKL